MLKLILPSRLPVATTERKPLSPGHLARVAIGGAVIAAWGILSITFVFGSWVQGIQRQATVVNSTEPGRSDLANGSSFHALLQTARTTCPDDLPLIVLNNGSAIHQLSDYYFYPRRVVSINFDEPFGQADLDTHKGGCIATFGPQNATRLDTFKASLKEVTCAAEGCLYIVK